jgi:hypothetical protein
LSRLGWSGIGMCYGPAMRAFGDTAIYVALGLFTCAWIGLPTLGKDRPDLALFLVTGAAMMVIVAIAAALLT